MGALAERVEKFNPNQPRDMLGRWLGRESGKFFGAPHLPQPDPMSRPDPPKVHHTSNPHHKFQWVRVHGHRAVVTRVDGMDVQVKWLNSQREQRLNVNEANIVPLPLPSRTWRERHGFSLDGTNLWAGLPGAGSSTGVFGELLSASHSPVLAGRV
jgi:hypothetical protein